MTPTYEIMVRYGVIPYAYSADGFKTINCEWLLRRYYKEFLGVELPESPFGWLRLFTPVPEGEPYKKNDMLFMMGANREGITDHVGVMITDHDMMHAAEVYGGVVCVPVDRHRHIILGAYRLK